MSGFCGADCVKCDFSKNCKGCAETSGSPFGGKCTAVGYIKAGGREEYTEYKNKLTAEVNALLRENSLPETEKLYELPGEYVNLAYVLPSGEEVKFLNDKNIYLGCQIEVPGMGVCFGVVADAGFILLSSYSINGSEPELICYKKR